ncbi:hypothetical protein SFRURICE_013546 [Spodoptera frugiperda]|nr:hypothetical protein SFRURICE_013546 [Spodoptera frugiperda]
MIRVDKEGKTKVSDEVLKAVANFFEDDSNSGLGAGKKDRPIQQISETEEPIQTKLSNLLQTQTFWIVKPKVDQRDTCLCITHANIDLKLTALHNGKILNYNSYQKLLQELCCDRYNEQCISRECQKCLNKTPSYKEFNDKKSIIYKKWIAEKAEFIDPKSKNTRRVTKHIKKSLDVNPRYLITELHEDLEKLFRHERNILHQFNSIKQLKNSLTEEDVLIHVDFSENYVTKYAQEIQAFHFGGSRTQISLHTVVVYLKDKIKNDTIQEMSAKIEQEGSKIKNFVGTLKVHQVTGKFYNSLDRKILYEDMQKLRVEDVFTDSETENDAGPSCITTGNAFNTGDYILVKLPAKNMEYRYVSVIDIIDEEEDELRVTFLKLCDKKGQTFRIDQMDVADVAMNQVIEKLPNPNLLMKVGVDITFKIEMYKVLGKLKPMCDHDIQDMKSYTVKEGEHIIIKTIYDKTIQDAWCL